MTWTTTVIPGDSSQTRVVVKEQQQQGSPPEDEDSSSSDGMNGCSRRQPRPLHMVEFFSGIGGMRCAVDQALSRQQTQVVQDPQEQQQRRRQQQQPQPAGATPPPPNISNNYYYLATCHAYEIFRDANDVYRLNFETNTKPATTTTPPCQSQVHTKLVEQLRVQDIPYADLWTLSPPCQPYTTTRFAKQRDLEDPRTRGLLAVLQLLRDLPDPQRPRWILLENVPGFVPSQTRKHLHEVLGACRYSWKECLLSPPQVGVPNHRTRFFILCEKSDRFFAREGLASIANALPTPSKELSSSAAMVHPRPIAEYLQPEEEVDWESVGLGRETLGQTWARDLPLVAPGDSHSHCFTAFYSRQLHRSTGSLLLLDPAVPSVQAAHARDGTLDRSDMTRYVGKIRRFTPLELVRLFGFGPSFGFPPGMRLQTQYKLVGNSINVTLVTELVTELLELK